MDLAVRAYFSGSWTTVVGLRDDFGLVVGAEVIRSPGELLERCRKPAAPLMNVGLNAISRVLELVEANTFGWVWYGGEAELDRMM